MRKLSVSVAKLVFWIRVCDDDVGLSQVQTKGSGLLYEPFSERIWQFYKGKGDTVVVGEVIVIKDCFITDGSDGIMCHDNRQRRSRVSVDLSHFQTLAH